MNHRLSRSMGSGGARGRARKRPQIDPGALKSAIVQLSPGLAGSPGIYFLTFSYVSFVNNINIKKCNAAHFFVAKPQMVRHHRF